MSLLHSKKIHDLLIIGAGPAGYTAGIYGARACLNTVILSGYQEGGQLMLTTEVENFPGFINIQGPELVSVMKQHALHLGVGIMQEAVHKVNFSQHPFHIISDKNIYYARSVIIATGAQAKWLGLPEEEKFIGSGVSACAKCDGFFFREKNVMIVGGGNTAMEEALLLTNYAKKITIVHRRDSLRGEQILKNRVLSHSKIDILWNHTIVQIKGEKTVKSVVVKNTHSGLEEERNIDGLFVAIGHKPSSALFPDLEKNEHGYIITKAYGTETNIPGIFAAGDVTDDKYRQAITAAAMGCMAALDAAQYLNNTAT